jgi:hypothetical protein
VSGFRVILFQGGGYQDSSPLVKHRERRWKRAKKTETVFVLGINVTQRE